MKNSVFIACCISVFVVSIINGNRAYSRGQLDMQKDMVKHGLGYFENNKFIYQPEFRLVGEKE